MSQGSSHSDHNQDDEITLPGLKGKNTYFPVFCKDTTRIFVDQLQKTEVVDQYRKENSG